MTAGNPLVDGLAVLGRVLIEQRTHLLAMAVAQHPDPDVRVTALELTTERWADVCDVMARLAHDLAHAMADIPCEHEEGDQT